MGKKENSPPITRWVIEKKEVWEGKDIEVFRMNLFP